MNKIFYIFLISFCLINCTSNTIIKKPDNLISKDKMVDVLTDLLLASGGRNIKNIYLKRNANYYTLVYQKHKIDSTLFKESNFYYTSKIDEYDEILERVDERLRVLNARINKEKKVQDSIKKIKRDSIQIIKNRKID